MVMKNNFLFKGVVIETLFKLNAKYDKNENKNTGFNFFFKLRMHLKGIEIHLMSVDQ